MFKLVLFNQLALGVAVQNKPYENRNTIVVLVYILWGHIM